MSMSVLPHPSVVPLPSNDGSGTTDIGDEKPSVMLYAPHLLPAVQHYIHDHAARLQRYRPVLAGRRRVDGISVAGFPNYTFDDGWAGRARECRYLMTGRDGGIEAFVRRHNVRLIHAHFGPAGSEIMHVASRFGIPLVVTFHGWDAKIGEERLGRITPYERLYRRRLPRLLQQAREVITVSAAWRERLVSLGCPPEKLRTAYLGVDSAFFDGARGDFDIGSIIYVGRLVKRKGVHTLLEAMGLLRDRGIDATLTVVGDGPEMASLQAQSAEHRLPVRFLGMQTQADVRKMLRQASVLCAPSTTAGGEVQEALGLVLLEAQAMCIPVVATHNGGIPEAVEDGRTGILVAQDAPDALADALARLIGDKALNRAFGEAARQRVCERFDVAKGYRAMEYLYDRILEERIR